MQGEEICGDAWLVRAFAGGWLCAVADGLGHGPIAAEAAATIIETVRTGKHTTRPIELLEAAHRAAKPTQPEVRPSAWQLSMKMTL